MPFKSLSYCTISYYKRYRTEQEEVQEEKEKERGYERIAPPDHEEGKKKKKPTYAPNRMKTMPIEGNIVGRKEASKQANTFIMIWRRVGEK